MPSIVAYNNLLEDIQEAYNDAADRAQLRYVNSVSSIPQEGDEVEWVRRNIDTGLAPITSPEQNSPILPQGRYHTARSTAVESRFIKAFNRQELANLSSADKRIRIQAEDHIQYEIVDQLRRAEHLQEMIANDLLVKGTVSYVEVTPGIQVKVLTSIDGFHISTASTTWDNTATATVRDDIDAELLAYWQRNNEMPAAMRMSRDTWNLMKVNTQVTNLIQNYMVTAGGANINRDDGIGGLVSRSLVIQAFDWPEIILDDASTTVSGTCASTTGATASETLTLNAQVYGIRPGDTLLVGWDERDGSYTSTRPVLGVGVTGRTLTIDCTAGAVTAGDICAVKCRFLPLTDVQFVPQNETANLEWRNPYYSIEVSGDLPVLPDRSGLTVDAFSAGEQGLAVFRRVWNKFGMRVKDPRKLQTFVTR